MNTLSRPEQALMRQKIYAYDIFVGNKPWNCGRDFSGKCPPPLLEWWGWSRACVRARVRVSVCLVERFVILVLLVGKSNPREPVH